MPRSTRVKGNIKPALTLSSLSGAPTALDPSDDLISVSLTDGDGAEAVTFSDFADGVAPLALEIEATWSGDKASLYHVLQANKGKTAVGFIYGRFGNTVASAGRPIYSGTVSIPAAFGWEASASESDADTFEVTLQIESGSWTHV